MKLDDEVNRYCLLFTVSNDPRHGYFNAVEINNGHHPDYPQNNPKARVLAALHDKLKECL